MRRYFVRLAYDGTAYHGWQVQPGLVSVQGKLQETLEHLVGAPVLLLGCGRTDAGVHARDFYAHFDHSGELDLPVLLYRWNRFLPQDIVLREIFEVKPEASARFDAQSRTYHYFVSLGKNPFSRAYSHYVFRPLDITAMREAAELLFQFEDFTSFSKLHSDAKHNLCTFHSVGIREQDGMLIFELSANRFLRNMVRAIVGTLLEVGLGRMDPQGFRKVIEARDRCDAGQSMPARALFLESVTYDWDKIRLKASE